jgi:hypothetical protein
MQLTDTKSSSIAIFSWTERLIESTDRLIVGLREEFHAIHLQGQDRAFLATSKGMTYAPLEEAYYSDQDGLTTH